jgi:GMP synthase-like glutamine amidotransferase
MPARFHAFEWHHRAFSTPDAGVELARSRHCSQSFRLGQRAWGVQFHPEVTESQIGTWLSQGFPTPVPPHVIVRETRQRIDVWNGLGEGLCRRFLELAEAAA